MRKLTSQEKKIIIKLLQTNKSKLEEFTQQINNYLVEPMNDGGMRSIRFIRNSKEKRMLGEVIAEEEFIDEDQIPVLISLNLDSEGEFFELDIWKVDFSPVKHILGID